MHDVTIGKKYLLDYDKLLAGDVILESGKKLHSQAIQFHTDSSYSHAMICLQPTSLFHAELKGIFTINPQRLLVENKTDLKVLRPKTRLTEDETNELIQFLRDKVGSIYSIKEALIAGKKERPSKVENSMQFCSRLVAQAYAHISYQIVDNIDFCQPAEIDNSTFFEEVSGIVKKATREEINFASTKNYIYENQLSTYKWLKKTRELAISKYNYHKIHKQNDVVLFMRDFPEANDEVVEYIKKSGYLENYKIDKENNPHMYNLDIFISKFQAFDYILFSAVKEYEIISQYKDRHTKSYQIAKNNYHLFPYSYFKLEVDLYKSLLSVVLKKFNTLMQVCNYLLQNLSKDTKLNDSKIIYIYNFLKTLTDESSRLESLGISIYQE